MSKRKGQLTTLFLLLFLLLTACQQNDAPLSENGSGDGLTDVRLTAVFPTAQPDTTLAPTFTPQSTFTPLASRTAPPSTTPPPATETPIPFGEIIVSLHYAIPGLNLDRYLTGDSSGRMQFIDNSTGLIVEQTHLEGAIFELRQTLPTAELTAVPDNCPLCIQISYELPLSGEQGSGWLQDEVLLASIENFTAAYLGAHFPPNTIIGLRRSASAYAPAHTLALTSNGRLWRWAATTSEIPPSDAPAFVPAELQSRLNQLPLDQLAANYLVNCPNLPTETLYLVSGDDGRTLTITCPEFSLPNTLSPLYLQLNTLLAEHLGDLADPRPPSAFPLTALIDYKRPDDHRLTLHLDGTAVLQTPSQTITNSVSLTQINDLVVGLTNSGFLQSGLQTFRPDEEASPVHTVVVRGADGVIDGRWATLPDDLAFRSLENLYNSLLETAE